MTPANPKQLQLQVITIMRSNPDKRTIRRLFVKAGKGMMSLHFDNTKQALLIAKQSKIVDEQRILKRKRVTIDANNTFTSIDKIIAA